MPRMPRIPRMSMIPMIPTMLRMSRRPMMPMMFMMRMDAEDDAAVQKDKIAKLKTRLCQMLGRENVPKCLARVM